MAFDSDDVQVHFSPNPHAKDTLGISYALPLKLQAQTKRNAQPLATTDRRPKQRPYSTTTTMAADDSMLDGSDEDEEVVRAPPAKVGRPPKAKPAASKAKPAPASSATKKAAPAPAAKARKLKAAPAPADEDLADEDDDMDGAGDDLEKEVVRLRRVVNQLERSTSDLSAERDGYLAERDAYIKQFDELSRLKYTEVEKNFNSYRHKAEERATKQTELIDSLTTALAKVKCEKAKLAEAVPLAAVVDKQPTREERTVQELEKALREQQRLVKDQLRTIEQRDKELKTEVENSQRLIAAAKAQAPAPAASSTKAQASDPAATDEAAKEKRKVAMYEDLTNLTVVKVELLTGQYGAETQWNCVYTADQRSLSFSIRQAFDASGAGVMYYIPKDLALETDKAFVEKLGFLAGEFTIRWDQVPGFWREMQTRLDEDGDDDDDDEMDE